MRGIQDDNGNNRVKDDAIGLIGGVGCLVLSELDPGWGVFWLASGVVLIAWSVISIYRRRARR